VRRDNALTKFLTLRRRSRARFTNWKKRTDSYAHRGDQPDDRTPVCKACKLLTSSNFHIMIVIYMFAIILSQQEGGHYAISLDYGADGTSG
jgi:hypothetical protein